MPSKISHKDEMINREYEQALPHDEFTDEMIRRAFYQLLLEHFFARFNIRVIFIPLVEFQEETPETPETETNKDDLPHIATEQALVADQ